MLKYYRLKPKFYIIYKNKIIIYTWQNYINIVYFIKDKNKNGGIYVNKLDYVKKIDNYKHELILNNNERILFDDIYSLEYEN